MMYNTKAELEKIENLDAIFEVVKNAGFEPTIEGAIEFSDKYDVLVEDIEELTAEDLWDFRRRDLEDLGEYEYKLLVFVMVVGRECLYTDDFKNIKKKTITKLTNYIHANKTTVAKEVEDAIKEYGENMEWN